MSNATIKVDNISKCFTISHEGKAKYTSLRDVVSQTARRLFSSGTNYAMAGDEEFWALQHVSFEINHGDRIGIIGRNGAGKSTLLKILSRITEPTAGRIEIDGRVASLLEVGTGFHPELTGRENIFLNGAILGMSRAEIRLKFDEIVSFAEVEQFLDTPVKRYSSGMYVRLAFAVAAHLEPDILIVDEVLAVGDSAFQKKCLGKMEEVSREDGRTLIFVSHNMGVIAQLCHKTILMEKGKLAKYDVTRKVIDQYLLNSRMGSNIYQSRKMDLPKPFYLERIETVAGDGNNSDTFRFDESIHIKALMVVKESRDEVKVSFTLQNMNGENLSTFVENIKAFDGQGSEVLAVVKLPSSLIAPGTYALRLAIFSEAATYDLVEMVCPFTIEETGSQMAIYQGYSYGNFLMDYKIVKSLNELH